MDQLSQTTYQIQVYNVPCPPESVFALGNNVGVKGTKPHEIREIPDHATFREKENTLGWLDKLGGFLSLTLCNLANFDQLCLPKYRGHNLI